MYEALKICAPITLMTFAIFTRFNMVVNPGWLQIADYDCWSSSARSASPSRCSDACHRNPVVDILGALCAGGDLVRGHVPSGHEGVGLGRPSWWRSQSSWGYTGTDRSRRSRARDGRYRCRAVPAAISPRPGRGEARHRIVLTAPIRRADFAPPHALDHAQHRRLGHATERATHRLDRCRAHGLPDGGAAAEAGHDVTIWNRTAAKAEPLARAAAGSSSAGRPRGGRRPVLDRLDRQGPGGGLLRSRGAWPPPKVARCRPSSSTARPSRSTNSAVLRERLTAAGAHTSQPPSAAMPR